MKEKKKRRLWPLVLLILVAGAGAAWHFYFEPRMQAASPAVNYASAAASSGTVSVTVTGDGILKNAGETRVTAPQGLKILSREADEGALVQPGDVLYTLDPESIEERLFTLEQEVASYARTVMGRSASDAVYSPVKGRMKTVYLEKGARVEDVMARFGMIAVVSTDDRMAVTLPAVLKAGEQADVSYTYQNRPYTDAGRVELVDGEESVVSFPDRLALPGDTVTVRMKDGRTFEGTCYIHAPLAVYGTEGLVKSVDAKENAPLTFATKLYTLESGVTNAAWEEAVHKRDKAEKELLLLQEYRLNPVIAAPEEGTVFSLALDEDGYTAKDAAVAVLHTGGAVKMTVDIDETDVSSLAVGQPVSVTPDAFPLESFPGTVTKLSRIGRQSGSVTVYEAELTLERDDRLLEGMRGSAVITTDTRENVVTVPVAVLQEDENGAYVLLSAAEGPVKRYVKTGISDGTITEITEGLSAGDTVLYTDRGAMDIVSKMMERSIMMAQYGGRR